MSEAPKILTVILADSGPTDIALTFENECRPFVRRTVQIELTHEQRELLRPRSTCRIGEKDIYEHVERCWLEPAPNAKEGE